MSDRYGWDRSRRVSTGLYTVRLGWDRTRRTVNSIVYQGVLSGLRVSSVDGTAFIDNAGATVPTFADGDHQIEIYDSSGRILKGFLSAAGSAETLDVELFTDPSFNDAGSWTAAGGMSISGGAASGNGGAVYQALTITPGTLVLHSMIATAASYYYRALAEGNSVGSYYEDTGTKTQYHTGVSSTAVSYGISVVNAAKTFTDISLKAVTAPSSSGAVIVSAKGGATQNFTSKDASFTYNSASYFCRVLRVR